MPFEAQCQSVMPQQKALVSSNIMCKYEGNGPPNKKVILNVDIFRHLSDQGQGHLKVKVKMSCLNGKLSSQATLCASMKEMGHQIKKLYSMLTFFRYLSDQGQGHFKVKVKMSCLNGKLSSQATLCASMKEMGHQIKMLYSTLTFFRY